jgi:hypothetical protein
MHLWRRERFAIDELREVSRIAHSIVDRGPVDVFTRAEGKAEWPRRLLSVAEPGDQSSRNAGSSLLIEEREQPKSPKPTASYVLCGGLAIGCYLHLVIVHRLVLRKPVVAETPLGFVNRRQGPAAHRPSQVTRSTRVET